jgi:hypothetical protein
MRALKLALAVVAINVHSALLTGVFKPSMIPPSTGIGEAQRVTWEMST